MFQIFLKEKKEDKNKIKGKKLTDKEIQDWWKDLNKARCKLKKEKIGMTIWK